MRLGLMMGYSGAEVSLDVALAQEAEALGYHSVWTAEAYGSDAVAPLAWLGAQTKTIQLGTAVMQLPGRSPACTAMTAMTLDALSGGRFSLGLGTSGPQVVEGWHGVPFGKPLTWLREYLLIVQQIFARQGKVQFEGERYQIPYRGPGSTGLGKPLKSIVHARGKIPIYSGSMAPKSQELCAELCDGLLLTCMHPERPEVITENLQRGFARAAGAKSLDGFDIAPAVAVIVGDDLDACRQPLKQSIALYMGGMGARSKNFYNEYIRRIGFEEAAERVQTLFLDGQREAAVAAVPDALVDALHLVGPRERIRDRLEVWKQSGVGTLLVGARDRATLRLMAELVL
jgi:F420-dependent oxidoreductase-like protein